MCYKENFVFEYISVDLFSLKDKSLISKYELKSKDMINIYLILNW